MAVVKASGQGEQQSEYLSGGAPQQAPTEPEVWLVYPHTGGEGESTQAGSLTQGEVQTMGLGSLPQGQPSGRGRGRGGVVVRMMGGPSLGSDVPFDQHDRGASIQPTSGSQFGRGRGRGTGLTGAFDQLTINPRPGPRRSSFTTGSGTKVRTATPPRRYSVLPPPPLTQTRDIRSGRYDHRPTYQPNPLKTFGGSGQKSTDDDVRSSRYDQDPSHPKGRRSGSPQRKCPHGYGAPIPSGAYEVSPFLDQSLQPYPTPYVAGQTVPLTSQKDGYPQDYHLVRDPADYKLPVPPTFYKPTKIASDLRPSKRQIVKPVELGKWVKVHYRPERNLLGEELYQIDSGEASVVEIYDPQETGKVFVGVDQGAKILETRASRKARNHSRPERTEYVDTYNRDCGYGRTAVEAGFHLFGVHVLNPSHSMPKDPVVYMRISRLSSEKIFRGKYILVLNHFNSQDWETVSSALNKKRLANVPRRDIDDVVDAIKRSFERGENDIVLIGESGDKETHGDNYAYLYTKYKSAEVHGRKDCMMLFEA